MLPNGAPKRLDTYIDIPLEIGLPQFISDDKMEDAGPTFGNFKLVLQSVVCHRGVSVDSGHYISLVRNNVRERLPVSDSDGKENTGIWLRFDDLAFERVAEVDIKKALREESPYLLFYQVQPIDEEMEPTDVPPPYEESPAEASAQDQLKTILDTSTQTSLPDTETTQDGEKSALADVLQSHDSGQADSRNSMSSNHRNSITFDDPEGSVSRGRTEPPTPDEQRASFLSASRSRRSSRSWLPVGSNKSRPTSQSGENRLSLTLSRLAGRGSKDKLPITEGLAVEEPIIVVNQVESADSGPSTQAPVKERKDGPISRSRSKKEKKDRFRSRSSGPSDILEKGKHEEKDRPDRECTIM